MQDNAFQPLGPTYTISGAPVQCKTTVNQAATSYRVRNVTLSAAYFAWAAALANGGVPTNMTTIGPAQSQPAVNQIGMIASSVEVFVLPPNAWFLNAPTATFEVTPGEGI